MTERVSVPGLDAAWATDPANGSCPNEDCVSGTALSDDTGLLIVVSDGMGGHAAGDTASRMVCDGLMATAPELARVEHSEDRFEILLRAFYDTDQRIREAASNDLRLLGMGATALSALITPTACLHLHTGDSRLYHFRNGQRLYRTRDHSVAELKVEVGEITEEQMHLHPMSSMLLASIGGGDRKGQLDVAPKWQEKPEEEEAELSLLPGDLLLLCSDGLNGVIGEPELQAVVSEHYDLQAAALVDVLIATAKEAGGDDNVTVGVVRVLDWSDTASSHSTVATGDAQPTVGDSIDRHRLSSSKISAARPGMSHLDRYKKRTRRRSQRPRFRGRHRPHFTRVRRVSPHREEEKK
jgi:serine/threonine protein phosphatase PrpC